MFYCRFQFNLQVLFNVIKLNNKYGLLDCAVFEIPEYVFLNSDYILNLHFLVVVQQIMNATIEVHCSNGEYLWAVSAALMGTAML